MTLEEEQKCNTALSENSLTQEEVEKCYPDLPENPLSQEEEQKCYPVLPEDPLNQEEDEEKCYVDLPEQPLTQEEEEKCYPDLPEHPVVPDSPPTYNEFLRPTAPEFSNGNGAMSMTVEETYLKSLQQEPKQPYPFLPNIFVQASTIPPLGTKPCLAICPSCHSQKMTTIRLKTTTKTHITAILMGLFGLCCVPYLIETCKNRNHYCGNCEAYLGSYDK